MANIILTFSHGLSQAEALDRIQDLMGDLKTEFEGMFTIIHEQWWEDGGTFSFSASGSQIDGKVSFPKQGELNLSVSVSFPASLIKGEIERKIREKAEKLLAK